MPDPTISQLCRTVQHNLSTQNEVLHAAKALAKDIGLAPFRIAHLIAALQSNRTAWVELNTLATSLELTGQPIYSTHAGPLPPGED